MQSFVDKRNGRAGETKESDRREAKHNYDELRVSIPTGLATKSGHPSAVNPQTSKPSVLVKLEDDANHEPATSKRLSGGNGVFYDTDASSIGLTSTAASLNGEVANAADDDQGEEYTSDVNGEEDAEEYEDEPDEQELRAYAPELDEAERRARASALERQLQTGANRGMGLPYTKGDSYPTTTSGNPSASEASNGGPAQNVDPQRGIQTTVHNIPHRQSNQRRPFTAASHSTQHVQPPAFSTHVTPNQAEPAFTGRHYGTIQDRISRVAPDSTYATAPLPQQEYVAAPTRNINRAPPPTTSTNIAQPSAGPTTGNKHNDLFSGQRQQHEQKRRDLDVLQNVSNTAQNRQLRQDWVGQQGQRVKFDPTDEGPPGQHEEIDHIQGDGHNTHHREPEKELDYDVEELYGMDYHDLKKETFDIDPNSQGIDNEQEYDTITQRMAALQGMPAETQAQLFKEFSIKEWEEGGDWFLDRFRAILNQLKDVRQQRRKAAQEYEDEIEGRFKAVGQKRKQIDVALSEMNESGGKVLQGTPKKTKTK